jgi:hypothetical protein
LHPQHSKVWNSTVCRVQHSRRQSDGAMLQRCQHVMRCRVLHRSLCRGLRAVHDTRGRSHSIEHGRDGEQLHLSPARCVLISTSVQALAVDSDYAIFVRWMVFGSKFLPWFQSFLYFFACFGAHVCSMTHLNLLLFELVHLTRQWPLTSTHFRTHHHAPPRTTTARCMGSSSNARVAACHRL